MNGPLVTSGSTGDAVPGALGQPNTAALFGANNVDFGLFSGIRADLGLFLDYDNRFSIDLGGFYLPPNSSSYSIAGDSSGNPLIARPYFNVGSDTAVGLTPNTPDRFTNSFPEALTGAIAIELRSQMAGAEINAAFHSYLQDRYHLEFFGGLRYLRLEESLQIHEQVNALNGTPVPFAGGTFASPDFITDQDNFHTLNQFIGPQIGARLNWEERWFSLGAFAKVALGATLEHSDIGGSTTLNVPGGASQTANGGVLALPSNSGSLDHSTFGIVPEFGLELRVNLTQNVALTFGYSFLLWNHVIRPGSQYDLDINPGQVNSSSFFGQTTGTVAPAQRFNEEVFWTNSFNLGLEVHF